MELLLLTGLLGESTPLLLESLESCSNRLRRPFVIKCDVRVGEEPREYAERIALDGELALVYALE